MALAYKIPRLESNLPFLQEVDFTKLQMQLAGRALTQRAAGEPSDLTAEEQKSADLFHHLVGVQPGLERLGMILSSTQSNSAWISGAKGTGKTTLVEALLRARAQNRLTTQLTSKPFFIFDPNSFAAAAFGGNPVQMFDEAMKRVAERNGLVIIDHMDDFMKSAGSEIGPILTGTLAKHLEERPDFQAIMVMEDSKDQFVQDNAIGIGRQFQRLQLDQEPKDDELKKILIAKFNVLEKIHNVDFTEAAADEMIRLLGRYPGRAFTDARPANAIKFADMAGTYVRLNKFAEPPELVEMREKIWLLRDQLAVATDGGATLDREIDALTDRYGQMEDAWRKKFEPLFKARSSFENIETKLAALRAKSARSPVEDQQLGIYAGSYDAARAKLAEEERNLYPEPPKVEAKHVRAIFAQESGISAATLSEDRLEHLSKLGEALDHEIVRQELAKEALENAYFQRETGISDPSRPAGVFMFLGGTGLGKTELTKVLARFDGGEGAEPVVIRLSELKGREAGKKLTGADPGLVGYEDGSCLDAVKENPRAILLLDEAEKADPSVFDVLMQVLEEGKLTPSNSKKPIEFKDTIIVLTSNALKARDLARDDLTNEQLIREKLSEVINKDTGTQQFKPEFIGRIDRVIVFEDLEPQDHVKILQKQIGKINRDYAGRGISVTVDDKTAAEIVKLHDDPSAGGRMSRNICGKFIRPLITGYLKQHIKEVMNEDVPFRAALTLGLDQGRLTLTEAAPHMPATSHAYAQPTVA